MHQWRQPIFHSNDDGDFFSFFFFWFCYVLFIYLFFVLHSLSFISSICVDELIDALFLVEPQLNVASSSHHWPHRLTVITSSIWSPSTSVNVCQLIYFFSADKFTNIPRCLYQGRHICSHELLARRGIPPQQYPQNQPLTLWDKIIE